jgi:urease accessory protein UreF
MPTPYRQQQQTQYQRSGRLKTLVPVGVILVGVLFAVVAGKQHHKVGHQVRQGMNAVGNQALRLGKHTHHDLQVVSTMLTATLTQVLRDAAAAHARPAVCWVSSGSSVRSGKFMAIGVRRYRYRSGRSLRRCERLSIAPFRSQCMAPADPCQNS